MSNMSRAIENIEAFLGELEAPSTLSDGNKRRAAIGLAFQPMREAVASYLNGIIANMQLEVAKRAEQGEKAKDIWRFIMEETRALAVEERASRSSVRLMESLSDQWSSKLRNYAAEVKNKLKLGDDGEALEKVLSFPVVNQEMLDLFIYACTNGDEVGISERPVPEYGVDRRPQWKYINGNDTRNVGCGVCGFVFERPSDKDTHADQLEWPTYMFKVGAIVTEVKSLKSGERLEAEVKSDERERLEITGVLDPNLPWKTRYLIANRQKNVYGRDLKPHSDCGSDLFVELPTTPECNHGSQKNKGVWSAEYAYDTAVYDVPFDLYRLFGPDADLGKPEAKDRWTSGDLPANETALLHIVAGLTPDPLIRRVADATRLRVRNVWGHAEPDETHHRTGVHLMATLVEMIGGDASEVLKWLDVDDVSKALGNAKVIEKLKDSLHWLTIMLPGEMMGKRVGDLEDRVERHDRRLRAVEKQTPLGQTSRPKYANWFREEDQHIAKVIKYLKECIENRDNRVVVCIYGMPGSGKSESLTQIVRSLRPLGFNDVYVECENVSLAQLQNCTDDMQNPLLVMDDVPSFDKLLDVVSMVQSKPLFVLAASRTMLFDQADIERSAAIDKGYNAPLGDVRRSVALQYVTEVLPWLDRLVVDRVVRVADGHSMCLEVLVAWFARFDADRVLRELDRMESDLSAKMGKLEHVYALMATAITDIDENTRRVLAAATMFPKYFTHRNIMRLLDDSDEDSVSDSLYDLTRRSLVTSAGFPWYSAVHSLIRDQFCDPDNHLEHQFVRYEASLLCCAWRSRFVPDWQLSDQDRTLLDYDDDQLNGISPIVNETPRRSVSVPVSQGMVMSFAVGLPAVMCATSDLVKEVRRVAIKPRHDMRYIVGYAAVDMQMELGNVNQLIKLMSQGTSPVGHYCWIDLVDSSSKDMINGLCDAQPYDESFVSCLIHVVGGYLNDDTDHIRDCIEWFRAHDYKQFQVYVIAKLSLCYNILGRDDEAVVALLEARDIYQASGTHISAAALVEAVTECGRLYCCRNRYDEAQEWLEYARRIASSSLYESSHVCIALNDALFSLYSCLERPMALESFKDLVRLFQTTISTDLRKIMRHYGSNMIESCDSDLLDTLLCFVRHYWKETGSFEDEDVLYSLNNVAIALCDVGRYLEARCLLEHVVEVRMRSVDNYLNPLMVQSLQSLATVLFFCGRFEQAETRFWEALFRARLQMEVAFDQPHTLDSLSLFATRCPLFHRVLEHDRDCPCVRIREWVFQGGQYHDQALNEFESMLELCNSDNSVGMNIEMAKIYLRQGNMTEYMECLSRVLDATRKNEFLHKYLLIYASAVDSSYEEHWRCMAEDEALPFLRSSRVIRLASVLKDYGAFKWLRKQYWQAEMYFNEAIDLLAIGCGWDDLLLALKLRNDANQLCHSGKHEQAESKYSVALHHVSRELQSIATEELQPGSLSQLLIGSSTNDCYKHRVVTKCANCQRQSQKHCNACQRVFYCSAECQNLHWKCHHKYWCRILQQNNDG